MTGKVISDKMMKTRVVEVRSTMRHAKYGKLMNFSACYKAHDEKNECREGDKVTVKEVRPISKTKTWALVSIDEKATQI